MIWEIFAWAREGRLADVFGIGTAVGVASVGKVGCDTECGWHGDIGMGLRTRQGIGREVGGRTSGRGRACVATCDSCGIAGLGWVDIGLLKSRSSRTIFVKLDYGLHTERGRAEFAYRG